MRRIFRDVIVFCLILVSSAVFAEPVGIVDLSKVNAAMHFRDIIKVRVTEATESENQSLLALNAKINAQGLAIHKQTSLSPEQKKQKEAGIESQREGFFKLQHDLQVKTVTLYQKETDAIKNKIEQTLGLIAEKHHLNKVFNHTTVAYAPKEIDLTDELIKELRKIYGTQKGESHDN